MTLRYTNPVTNQVRRIMEMAEGKKPPGLRPYTPPNLIANIEAEANGDDPADDVASRLGIPPQGGIDLAAANAARIASPPQMFPSADAPTLMAEINKLPKHVPETLEGLIANERAAQRRPKPNYAGAGGGPGTQGLPAYTPPKMPW